MKKSKLLEEMFEQVVVKKQAHLQSRYYHQEFKLYANGIEQNYDEYIAGHEQIYKTPIQYKFRIDRDTIVDSDDKTAMRVFITINDSIDGEKEIEVILVAYFKDNKIYRVWELTRPDWSQMETFRKDYFVKH